MGAGSELDADDSEGSGDLAVIGDVGGISSSIIESELASSYLSSPSTTTTTVSTTIGSVSLEDAVDVGELSSAMGSELESDNSEGSGDLTVIGDVGGVSSSIIEPELASSITGEQ